MKFLSNMNQNIIYYISTRLKNDFIEFNRVDYEQYQTIAQNPFCITELNDYGWAWVCSLKNKKEYLKKGTEL